MSLLTKRSLFATCSAALRGEHPIVGTIAAGSSSPASISVDVAKAWHKLSPSSFYIYHVDATHSNWAFEGSAYGENKVFKTAGASPPSIESESVSHLTSTDATLEAAINDERLEATYEFHLLTAPTCLTASPPCERPQFLLSTPAGTLLASGVGQSVSVDLNDAGITLYPGERYEYWVSAASSAGTTEGAHQVLIAPKEPASSVNSTISQGPVSNEPEVPLAGNQPTSGDGSSPPTGDPIPTGMMPKPAHPIHGKPSTKHGKRRKHHGKHTGTHHTKKR